MCYSLHCRSAIDGFDCMRSGNDSMEIKVRLPVEKIKNYVRDQRYEFLKPQFRIGMN
jgi:hypothetical protein